MSTATRPTRRRGRRWLVLGVLATGLVLLVNAALSARSSAPARQLAEQSYLDKVQAAIEESSQQGRAIDTLRSQALHLTAATTVQRLGELAASGQRVLETVQRVTVPVSMQTAHDLLEAAMALRADGVRTFRDALSSVMGGRSEDAALGALDDVGQDFQAADRAYRLFVKAAAPAATLPSSEWVTDPAVYSQTGMEVFLASLRSAASVSPVHDVGVVLVTTDPVPVTLNGTTEILPSTSVLNLQAVIADTGNQPERNLLITAMVSPSADGSSSQVRNFIDLSPGQRRTVNLGGLRLRPGQPTTLTVRVEPVPGETNLNDNTKVIVIQMQ